MLSLQQEEEEDFVFPSFLIQTDVFLWRMVIVGGDIHACFGVFQGVCLALVQFERLVLSCVYLLTVIVRESYRF